MSLLGDADLLKSIARKAKNQPSASAEAERAFNELAKRHAPAMHNLAMLLLGDCSLAEEAIQSALIAIWKGAESFDSEKGAGRTWLLRILANQALRMRVHTSKEITRKARCNVERPRLGAAERAAGLDPAVASEEGECLGWLRQAVASLPERDRLLVALYYGAAFTQHEIARRLALPQSSVSDRLNRIVGQLRSGLLRAGFAVACHPAEWLNAAICSGCQAPGNLVEIIRERLSRAPEASWAGAGKGALGPWGLGVGALFAFAVGAAVWELGRSQIQTPDGQPNRSHSTAAWTLAKAAAPGDILPGRGFSRGWNFDNPGDYPGLVQVDGFGFRRLPAGGVGNSGCLETVRNHTILALETESAQLPLQVSMQVCFTRSWTNKPVLKGSGYVFFSSGPLTAQAAVVEPMSGQGQWPKVELYLTRRFSLMSAEGVPRLLFLYARDQGNTGRIEVQIIGPAWIDNLELKEASLARIPDVSPILAAIERIPAPLRQGEVPLPPFPGAPAETHWLVSFP